MRSLSLIKTICECNLLESIVFMSCNSSVLMTEACCTNSLNYTLVRYCENLHFSTIAIQSNSSRRFGGARKFSHARELTTRPASICRAVAPEAFPYKSSDQNASAEPRVVMKQIGVVSAFHTAQLQSGGSLFSTLAGELSNNWLSMLLL